MRRATGSTGLNIASGSIQSVSTIVSAKTAVLTIRRTLTDTALMGHVSGIKNINFIGAETEQEMQTAVMVPAIIADKENTMYEYKAKMIKVVDGDTMDFEVDLGFKIKHEIRVRLKDVDTPEIFRPKSEAEKVHGLNATSFVVTRFLGQTGVLRTYKDKKGKYGRYLADFSIEGSGWILSLCEELISRGFEKKESYE